MSADGPECFSEGPGPWLLGLLPLTNTVKYTMSIPCQTHNDKLRPSNYLDLILSPRIVSGKTLAVTNGPKLYKLAKDIFNLIPLIFFTFAIPGAINPSLGKHFTNYLRLWSMPLKLHSFPRRWNQKSVLELPCFTGIVTEVFPRHTLVHSIQIYKCKWRSPYSEFTIAANINCTVIAMKNDIKCNRTLCSPEGIPW